MSDVATALLTFAGLALQAPPVPLPRADEDKEFVKRVNQAVDRADDWLKKRQEGDGGYGVYHFHSGRDYVAGRLPAGARRPARARALPRALEVREPRRPRAWG